MTKKEYILAVIDALPDREMWWWIKAMVQNNQLDDETIDKLVIVFKRVMAKMAAEIRETKAIETLKSMKVFDKQKEEQAKKDAKSLKELDSKLKNL